ncbi:MAG: hypothetical protein AB2L24_23750 [Mangrovibacterium sp.]
MKQVSASALPTVLIVSTLILLLMIFAFNLWDMNAIFYYRYHYVRQLKYHVNSGFMLYCSDSSFANRIEPDSSYMLYQEDKSSRIRIAAENWGLYECVRITSAGKEYRSTRLLGKDKECHYEAAFWLNDQNRPLSLSGNTNLEGKIYAPRNGINYTQVRSDYYQGEMIPGIFVKLSEEHLPEIDSAVIDQVDNLCRTQGILSLDNLETTKYHSFQGEAAHFRFGGDIDHLNINGKVVLHGDKIRISSESKLNDVIVTGSKVTVESGFKGSLQIFAEDTVIMEDQVQLDYPSGVYIGGNPSKSYLEIGNHCELHGYAIVMGELKDRTKDFSACYFQADSSKLYGLLYVSGVAVLNGEISGAAYLADCFYKAEEGDYAGTLYNVKISRNDEVAYPFLLKGEYRRKEIKSVH